MTPEEFLNLMFDETNEKFNMIQEQLTNNNDRTNEKRPVASESNKS